MARTPIAGVVYRRVDATGHDDLLLVESDTSLATAIALLARRTTDVDGSPLDIAALPVGDIDALVTELRAQALGDGFIVEGSCPACDAAVDLDFSLRAFRAHRRPHAARGAKASAEPGWWELARDGATFRLPRAGDVLAAQEADDPAADLAARCVRGSQGAATIRAAERAMAVLGPTLRQDVEGSCPDCAATVDLDVDVRELCLQELRFLAQSVLEDVDVLAGEYGWDEPAILDLPARRRAAYAELVHSRRRALVSADFGG